MSDVLLMAAIRREKYLKEAERLDAFIRLGQQILRQETGQKANGTAHVEPLVNGHDYPGH